MELKSINKSLKLSPNTGRSKIIIICLHYKIDLSGDGMRITQYRLINNVKLMTPLVSLRLTKMYFSNIVLKSAGLNNVKSVGMALYILKSLTTFLRY